MKRTRTKFAALAVTVLMALLCIMAAFGGLFQSAYADGEVNYTTKENCKIYYFCDYYPTLSAKKISEEYDGLPVCYEYKYVYEQGFYKLIDENYFSGWNSDQIVIIDIKTFKPDDSKLDNLFNSFRREIYKLMFVSAYPASDYTDTTFGGNVDSFIYDNCQKLDWFIGHAVENLDDRNGTLSHTAILLDGKLVDSNYYINSDKDIICQSSPFVRILLEKLAMQMGLGQNFSSYNEIVNLLARLDVKLIVHCYGKVYADLMNGGVYIFNSVSDLYNEMAYYNVTINHVCGMGFWSLNHDFYNFLKAGKVEIGVQNLPIYIMQVEPITYSEDGLDIITDFDLEDIYGEFDDNIAEQMLNEISGWL